jgi:hypothetical protein
MDAFIFACSADDLGAKRWFLRWSVLAVSLSHMERRFGFWMFLSTEVTDLPSLAVKALVLQDSAAKRRENASEIALSNIAQ